MHQHAGAAECALRRCCCCCSLAERSMVRLTPGKHQAVVLPGVHAAMMRIQFTVDGEAALQFCSGTRKACFSLSGARSTCQC